MDQADNGSTWKFRKSARRLAALLDAEAPDIDAIDTAKNEVTASEKRHQAVMVADGGNKAIEITGTPETRELLDLEKRANVGELFDSVLSHGQPIGAMAELQQHLGLQGNQIPLALISRFSNREERAVTPAPGNVGQEQNAIIPYVFPQSAASFLGVEMPTVGVGDAIYPVLTSTLAVGTPAENAEPRRNNGRLFCNGVNAKPDSSGLFLQPRGPGAFCWHGLGPTGEPERRTRRWP